MARCAGGRGARMAWMVEEQGHVVALWMVGTRMAERRWGEDGGICRGGNPWNGALPSMSVGQGQDGRAAAEAIPGTVTFHRWSVGRGREWQGGRGGFPELRLSIEHQ
jgi:hypothetical protein